MKASLADTIPCFKTVNTKRELAESLGSSLKTLSYNLYVLPSQKRYTTYNIPKRNGGIREICAPTSGIKIIQKRLANILLEYHPIKFCVHGYVKNKSIITNAQTHQRQRIIINIDLKDFFSSINFGRVRGIFKNYPFNFNDIIATTLAQICCHDGKLPQGAPTSPIISNYICHKLDNELIDFARKQKVKYSRYADDITFSTNLKYLPKAIGRIKNKKLIISNKLKEIFINNGFVINDEKTRYALRTNRQEITGLIVNSGVNVPRKYITRIRAMLHAWEKFGITSAAKEHFEKFNYKHKTVEYPETSFKNEITGMLNYIGQVKGKGNSVYTTLYYRIKKLDSNIKLSVPENIQIPENTTIIFCEGKTDPLHLETAFNYFRQQGMFTELNIHFFKWRADLDINNDYLMQMCRTRPKAKRDNRVEIYLFDRDTPKYVKEAQEENKPYKHWGANVYSTLLPIPSHRRFSEICIEHFYSDDDIMKKDKNNRRLYTTKEFDAVSGNHITNKEIYYAGSRAQLNCKYPKILDSNVKIISSDINIALSKNNFARNIANKVGDFKNVSFDYFRPIFELLKEIIAQKHTDS